MLEVEYFLKVAIAHCPFAVTVRASIFFVFPPKVSSAEPTVAPLMLIFRLPFESVALPPAKSMSDYASGRLEVSSSSEDVFTVTLRGSLSRPHESTATISTT